MDLEKTTFCAGKVSIVTPVYNGELHLGRMLESVLAQTYPDIEMILVDDGSGDRTVETAQQYRERFTDKGYAYRVVRAEHRNASAAINRGLPCVTGEYLIWPDSDDVLEPESVEKRVSFLKEHPEYQCVRSLAYYFYAETGKRSETADERQGDLEKEDLFWDILESRTFVCCGCYMLKSEAFFAIYPKRRIPEYGVGQNFQMLLPFMYEHKCPTIREKLYGVVIRQDSHSRRQLTQAEEEKKYRDYENLIDDIVRICRISSEEERDRIMFWKARRRYIISWKYGKKGKTLAAVRLLHKYRQWNNPMSCKDLLWFCFATGRVGRRLYAVYQKTLEAFGHFRRGD